jgi:trk system potassium uptake protein TrkH
MRFQRITPPIGLLLCVLAASMLLPAMVDYSVGNADWQVFLASAFFTGGLGASLFLGFRGAGAGRWSRRDGFVFVAVSWFVVSVAAALPFHFSTAPITGIAAFFESVSGLTTTGATVLSGLDTMAPGILLWRSLLHWIGGVGIVVM